MPRFTCCILGGHRLPGKEARDKSILGRGAVEFIKKWRTGAAGALCWGAVMSDLGASPDSSETTPLAPMHHPYAVLRNRDLILYLSGRFVAFVGQAMLTVAVGWELYERTHSALSL